jgi:1-acyl-sn-glycerol-3-phosphate acyltransferase
MSITGTKSKHTENSSFSECGDNKKLTFPVPQSNKSRLAGKLRYWWCWFVAGFLMLVVGLPVLVFLGIIKKKMWIYPIARWGANLWLSAAGAKIDVKWKENLDPDRTYVFIANHRSYLDTVALFFHTGHKVGLVAKKELLKVPIFGQGMHYVNIFAIDRSNSDRAKRSLEKAKKIMAKGSSFGVFAEGTRAMPGELLPFKKGAFHLAIQTGADIIPVAIKNTDMMMGKRTGLAFPGTIEMVLLPPVEINDDLTQLLSTVRSAVADELAASVHR